MALKRSSRRGLTFFETMVVFVIIAVLVALVFLATRRLMVDSKVTRAREEQRIISRALQNYVVDQYAWPAQEQGLVALSEPVTYLASIPLDIFAPRDDEAASYAYRTYQNGAGTHWVLISRGPDGDIDFDGQFQSPAAVASGSDPGATPRGLSTVLPESLLDLSYDPTNGLGSNGDILTLAPYPLN